MRLGLKTSTRSHVWLYRTTRGMVGKRVGRAPILLLTTLGRKSGIPHTAPLGFARLDDRIVVCGANLGADAPPAWFLNLQADPHVRVTIGSRTFPAIARVANAGERADLWTQLIEQLPALITYQERTTRTFPVVILEPHNSSNDLTAMQREEAQPGVG